MPPGDPGSLSIVTPTYQSGPFLGRALASVRGRGVQHVVMDGGSSDGTVALLEAEPAVTWRSEPDRGQSHALNKALTEATGTWIGWLNADEFYLPGVLEWVQERLRADDVDVLFGDFAEVDTEGRLLRLVTNHRYSPSILRRVNCYLPTCATFIRRESLVRVGGLREDLRTIMDWDLWLRLDRAGARFGYEPVVFAGFTRHPGQVTERLAERSRQEKACMRADFGIVNPLWRHHLSRAHRVALKTVNGSYRRQLRAQGLRGTPLGSVGDPLRVAAAARLNPQVPVAPEDAG
ncbi:glycosyltransferase family 2 protein [Geodermatophilus sp. TF02-6]|uniref:glycosyltransferase family 2 protein n=1 Tax=Geodermatophilus sp. TF02-6 TaxID=2250575 RepID=UPI001314EFBA|nr:glycosyltransferase family 2 protein [Geodermatophilus sp. TF02-6]